MRVGQWPVGVVQLAPSAGNRRLRVGGGEGRTCQQDSGAWEGNRRIWGRGEWDGGRQGLWQGSGKRSLDLHFGQTGEEISDTCNIYWKSSRPWPWR